MTETKHQAIKISLGPRESIEDYGYTPDDIITAEDATYTSGRHTQDLLEVWVWNEVEVEGDDDGE